MSTVPDWINVNNDNITKPATPPPTPPSTNSRRPHPVILLIVGALIGVILASAMNTDTPQTSTEYRTPPACIEALDLAHDGFAEIGEGLTVAGNSNLTDLSQVSDATAWLDAHNEDMRIANSTCRESASSSP